MPRTLPPDFAGTARQRTEILLATYNSADYLQLMLDSLAAQTFRDFHLIVSDDMSTDGTVALVEAAAGKFQHPVEIIRRTTPSGSASANFGTLLARSEADYVLLADHDDIWFPGKVERAIARIRAVEARKGTDMPVMTHSDLCVINADGMQTAPSYWSFKSIDPRAGQRLGTALVYPTVTGCAMAMNRALVARTGVIPEQSLMHDWWINLVAASFGEVDYDPEPQILYRIHGRNVSKPRRTSLFHSAMQFDRYQRLHNILHKRVSQGSAFRERYLSDLPADARKTVEVFASLPSSGPLSRRWKLLKGGFFMPRQWWRNLTYLAFA
ncbi:MAG TPA: glycosyltransferase family 2 protein [Paenirhodobacter sp.]